MIALVFRRECVGDCSWCVVGWVCGVVDDGRVV
jgi:hypothetical protein